MLSLEINAGLLQAPQMSGLAMLLSNLVKYGGSSNTNGTSGGDNVGESSGKGVGPTVTNGASGSKTSVNGGAK